MACIVTAPVPAWTTVASADQLPVPVVLPEFWLIAARRLPFWPMWAPPLMRFVPTGQVAVETPVTLPSAPLVDVTEPEVTVHGVPSVGH